MSTTGVILVMITSLQEKNKIVVKRQMHIVRGYPTSAHGSCSRVTRKITTIEVSAKSRSPVDTTRDITIVVSESL
jgi:hypothetical protein